MLVLTLWKLIERKEYILKNTLKLLWLKEGDSLGSSSSQVLPGTLAGMGGPDTGVPRESMTWGLSQSPHVII